MRAQKPPSLSHHYLLYRAQRGGWVELIGTAIPAQERDKWKENTYRLFSRTSGSLTEQVQAWWGGGGQFAMGSYERYHRGRTMLESSPLRNLEQAGVRLDQSRPIE